MGYILRLTEVNDYDTPSWILQLAGIKKYLHSKCSFVRNNFIDLSSLAQITGVSVMALSSLQYERVSIEQFGLGYLLHGEAIPHYMMRIDKSKICPECLDELGYSRKLWDVAPVTACPVHRRVLIENCPKCFKPITWSRRKLCICQCGFDWRKTPRPQIQLSELNVSQQIHRLCRLTETGDAIKIINVRNPLFDLDLCSFVSALFFVASQFDGIMDTKGKHLAPSRNSFEIHTLLSKAFKVFEEWPDSFFAFLDWRRTQSPNNGPAKGLGKHFGQYKVALYEQLSHEQFNFLRSSFEKYLITRWDEGYVSHLKRFSKADRRHAKYLSKEDAKEILKIGGEGIDKLISAGTLRAVLRSPGKNRLILIERDSINNLKKKLSRSLYLVQVQELLGLSRHRVADLVKHGLLNPLRGPDIDGCSNWKFSMNEVKELLRQIKKRVKRPTLLTADSSVNFLMAFRTLSHANVGIGQFTRSILEDKISPCGKTARKGLVSFLFLKQQIAEYAGVQRRSQLGEVFCATEAAKQLEVTPDVIRFLVKRRLLPSQEITNPYISQLIVSRSDIEYFNSTYVLLAKIAAQLETV